MLLSCLAWNPTDEPEFISLVQTPCEKGGSNRTFHGSLAATVPFGSKTASS